MTSIIPETPHVNIPLLLIKKLGREVGLTVLQPGLDELLLGKEL